MQARLIDESGFASPSLYHLDDSVATSQTPVTLGRHPSNHVILRDPLASRRHAQVYYREGCWYLRDQEEVSNPTLVDDVPCRGETLLRDGQLIQIGMVRIRFRFLPDSDPNRLSELTAETTVLEPDDLTMLLRFLEAARGEMTPHRLVTLALDVLLKQTRAEVVGFLGESSDPEMRVVLPYGSQPDRQLSQRLNRLANEQKQLVWLASLSNTALQDDSLQQIHDAVCIPLVGRNSAQQNPEILGTLHAYKRQHHFTSTHIRFCHVLAANLTACLQLSIRQRALIADNERLQQHSGRVIDHTLIGSGPVMSRLRDQIRRVSRSPSHVLICGETGVGKELVARAIHHASPRSNRPFVTVNCANISVELAESELFGHQKGAFTHAVSNRLGLFAEADMGTLFLDEVGDLPLAIQTKLLRVMQDKRFRSVGGQSEVSVDVRILAATNRNLEEKLRAGSFREDFYYRFPVPLQVPPLRERREDIPELAQFLLNRLQREYNRQVRLSPSALARLQEYHWPGNVRQLEGVLERALLNTDSDYLEPIDLPLEPRRAFSSDGPPSLKVAEVEKWLVRRALEQTGGNKSAAAELLGVDRSTLYKMIERTQEQPR